MDVDTLVRHDLPVVMVMGNNSAWGLEKGPMQMIYGYDVAADLAQQTRYDEVVKALGGAGERVTDPRQIGPALDRAFAAGTPYLVNVITDVERGVPARHVRDLMPEIRRARPDDLEEVGRSHGRGVRGVPRRVPGDRLRRPPARRRAARPRGRALGGRRRRRHAARIGDLVPGGLAVARAVAAGRG